MKYRYISYKTDKSDQSNGEYNLSKDEIKKGINILIRLTLETSSYQYPPQEKAQSVYDYILGKETKLDDIIKEIESTIDEPIVLNKKYIINDMINDDCNVFLINNTSCNLLELFKWKHDFKNNKNINILFKWLLEIFIKHYLPVEIYLRSVEIILYYINNNKFIDDDLKLIGIASISLAEDAFVDDIEMGLNCKTLNYGG